MRSFLVVDVLYVCLCVCAFVRAFVFVVQMSLLCCDIFAHFHQREDLSLSSRFLLFAVVCLWHCWCLLQSILSLVHAVFMVCAGSLYFL